MLRITLEPIIADDGTERIFAHLEADQVLGNAAEAKRRIPKGAWVTIPPRLKPMDEWLVRKWGFVHIGEVDLDDGVNAVLEKR